MNNLSPTLKASSYKPIQSRGLPILSLGVADSSSYEEEIPYRARMRPKFSCPNIDMIVLHTKGGTVSQSSLEPVGAPPEEEDDLEDQSSLGLTELAIEGCEK